ncbi:PIN domain-containing protein [Planktotalea sp.]|uniref:PIN domain-containing protein n=1 Tax=Planktotalea sp. TaxID=2029877 RepID=UPI00329889AE
MVKEIYIDSNFYIQQGRDLSSPSLEQLHDLVEAGELRIFTTDHTKNEVRKKLSQNAYDALAPLTKTHVRSLAIKILQEDLPNLTSDILRKDLDAYYERVVGQVMRRLRAREVSIDTVKPSAVLNSYSKNEGVFSSGAKKNQFPDAFILAAIKKHRERRAKRFGTPQSKLLILSKDKDFQAAEQHDSSIRVVETVEGLFKYLGYSTDGPDVGSWLEDNEDFQELLRLELEEWQIEIEDVEDAEVDYFEISDIQFGKIKAFAPIQDGGDLLVLGKACVYLSVDYTHPDWDNAAYDSEDKKLIPFDSVSGISDTELNVGFSGLATLDANGVPSELTSVSLDISSGLYIQIRPYPF